MIFSYIGLTRIDRQCMISIIELPKCMRVCMILESNLEV